MDTILAEKKLLVEAATGVKKADLVLKNADFYNVFTRRIEHGDIAVTAGKVVGIGSYDGEKELDLTGKLVAPGFVDAHIHLESSLVSPAQFAKAVVPHGTTCVVTDPHEITNVMGTDGIEYMLAATEGLPLDVRFVLPSCVPATPLDEAGAELSWEDIDRFYADRRVLGLAEMMNAFGVVHNDPAVLSKIAAADGHGRVTDGHAPGIAGKELDAYIAAGVGSDHECSDADEALEKLRRGQYIMIREGTAARNLKALTPLLQEVYADRCLFCTDDKHPSDLLELGHIDYIIREAVRYGADPLTCIRAATWNAAQYFRMYDRGAIAPGYLADFTVLDSISSLQVVMTVKNGKIVCENGRLIDFAVPRIEKRLEEHAHNTFRLQPLAASDFPDGVQRGIIGMVPGEIVSTDNGRTDKPDLGQDILKIAVLERHKNTGHIGLGYIQGYGLKSGAVATSISHDSHNIIVVGATAEDMAFAANQIIKNRGGICIVQDGQVLGEVKLEIAGLMSDTDLHEINAALEAAKDAAYALGVNHGIDPFMTLSFMSLPVIPTLRLTTKGMVDVLTQQFI